MQFDGFFWDKLVLKQQKNTRQITSSCDLTIFFHNLVEQKRILRQITSLWNLTDFFFYIFFFLQLGDRSRALERLSFFFRDFVHLFSSLDFEGFFICPNLNLRFTWESLIKEVMFCSSANSSLHSCKMSTVLLLMAQVGDCGKLKLFHFLRTLFCSSISISGENSTDFWRGMDAVLVRGAGIRVLGLCLASIFTTFCLKRFSK